MIISYILPYCSIITENVSAGAAQQEEAAEKQVMRAGSFRQYGYLTGISVLMATLKMTLRHI